MPVTPLDVALILLLGTALTTDIVKQKIPNLLTFGVMGLALIYQAVAGSVLQSFLGIVLGFALMFPGFALGGAIRAGDAKLLMAVGALLGPHDVLRACLFTYALAVPFGLVVLAFKGKLRNLVPTLRATWQQQQRKRRGEPEPEDAPKPDLTIVIFAPVIVVAVAIARLTPVLTLWTPGVD